MAPSSDMTYAKSAHIGQNEGYIGMTLTQLFQTTTLTSLNSIKNSAIRSKSKILSALDSASVSMNNEEKTFSVEQSTTESSYLSVSQWSSTLSSNSILSSTTPSMPSTTLGDITQNGTEILNTAMDALDSSIGTIDENSSSGNVIFVKIVLLLILTAIVLVTTYKFVVRLFSGYGERKDESADFYIGIQDDI